jgi:DNA-binding LacI/PurR family transcriptional regulator
LANEGKATIYDVAKLAGVSHQTVSRVMNDHGSIRPETRARVEAAAKELNYRPSMAARALVTNRNSILGFLVADSVLYGPAGMLNAMEKQARLANYYALTVAIDNNSPESWAEGIEHLRRIGIEGLVCIAIKKEALELATKSYRNIPIVAIDTEEVEGATTIGIDNHFGAVEATKHLIELGHKNILHMSGPKDSIEAQARLAGYQETMLKNDLQPVILQGDWSSATGLRLGVDLNLTQSKITAVFSANDQMALGLFKAMRLKGVSIPEDLSVIGFDDVPEAPYFSPPITTMLQDFNRLGEAAMELLIFKLAGLKPAKYQALKPQMVLRESTAPPQHS